MCIHTHTHISVWSVSLSGPWGKQCATLYSYLLSPHCDQPPTECVWPPPAISVWSHNEGHGDGIASIIHTQRQARLKHVKQYRPYESCIKRLSVAWRRHDVYACVTAHRCAYTQKVSHTFPPHGTAVNPLPPPLLTILISQLRRGDRRFMLSKASSEAP